MIKIILYSVVLCFSMWLLKAEIRSAIEALFKTILIIFHTLEYTLSDLKQRTRMEPPFNTSLSRILINLTLYGILLGGMVLAVIGNFNLLKTRLEALMPFEISEESSAITLSGIVAILITFMEIASGYLIFEAWTNPSFLRTDIDPTKPDRPHSFVAAMPIVFMVLFLTILGIDVCITYYGNYLQTQSVLGSVFMSFVTIALSCSLGIIGFFYIASSLSMIIALLRNLLSLFIECCAFVVFLLDGMLSNLMVFILRLIDIVTKIGETIAKPFLRFKNKPITLKLPVPAKIAIILALIGLVSFAWSSQLRISKICFVVLLDLTGSFHYAHESYEHVDHIINTLLPGEEIYVLSIKEASFQDRNILFSGHIPLPKYTNEIYSKEYRARVDSLRAMLNHNWKKVVKTLRTDAKRTDITGSIGYAALIFANTKSKQKYLVVFSDLEDNVAEKCDVKLSNVKIWCLYVEHSDFSQYQEKEKLWKEYFKRAGVEESNIIIRIPAQSSMVEIR